MILRAARNLDQSEGWVETVSSHFLTVKKRSSSKLAIKKLPTNEQLCALGLLEFVSAQLNQSWFWAWNKRETKRRNLTASVMPIK